MKRKVLVLFLMFSGVVFDTFTHNNSVSQHYYVTPSDALYFDHLKNLIGSIHHNDSENLGEIAVFDLGLNSTQRDDLKKMWKVQVYDVEMVHPQLLTPLVTAPWGRAVRGYFAWKPVIMKQALEMFPYYLYLDAAVTILQPMDDIFTYIQEQGYFLISCGDFTQPEPHLNIVNRITTKVLNEVVGALPEAMQKHILDEETIEISANIQGIAGWHTTAVHEYVMPIYEHAKDLTYFEDDGSAKYGYGHGRHDQILYSIYAHALNLHIFPQGLSTLMLSTGPKMMQMHHSIIDEKLSLLMFRGGIDYKDGSARYIQYSYNQPS